MKAFLRKLNQAIILIVISLMAIACADENKQRAVESIGTQEEGGPIEIRLSAVDLDVRDEWQNADYTELNFTLRFGVDNDLCDLVDVQVTYEIQYDLNHPDPAFGGKNFSFTADLGRIKRGHTKEESIVRKTNGPVALDSIKVTKVTVRDAQNCTTDPFRPA